MKVNNKIGVFFIITFALGNVYAQETNRWGAADSSDTLYNGATAPATKDYIIGKQQSTRLDFDFNGNKAWLNNRGEWQVSGYVKHTKLRCATYSVAIRFGRGENQCTNVNWIGTFQKGSYVRQCNAATVHHIAGETNQELVNNLTGITCAKIQITCSGACN